MKRIVAFVITLLLLTSVSLPAYADLDNGDFDNWYVLCGPAGYSFVDVPDLYQEDEDLHDYIEPGIRIWVHSFDSKTKEYLLVISDENHKNKGKGFAHVPEDDFEKYFIDEKKTVNKEVGEKLKEEVQCVVTSDIGIVLRQGPAKTFPAYRNIPHNANISYQYTFEYGGYHWGYTTYKGQTGWTCIDYTEKVVPTTESTTKPTTEPTTKMTTESATEENTATADATAENVEASESSAFFSNTGTVIIISCLGAVILALTAVIILLLVKRKKEAE